MNIEATRADFGSDPAIRKIANQMNRPYAVVARAIKEVGWKDSDLRKYFRQH